MSIQDLGALGEFVGSLGVIVTLIYLAIQIRSNTRATKASAGFQATHSWADLNEQLTAQPDDILATFVGIYAADFDPDQLNDVQYLRLTLFTRAMFQKLEGQFFLYKFGLLDQSLWQQRSSIGRGVIEVPHIASWWEGEKRANTFSPEFVQAIEAATPVDATQINARIST